MEISFYLDKEIEDIFFETKNSISKRWQFCTANEVSKEIVQNYIKKMYRKNQKNEEE